MRCCSSVKTGDPIRIRGLVQDVFLRTMVKIGPGVVVGGSESDRSSANVPAGTS